jgi:hypothetical protein
MKGQSRLFTLANPSLQGTEGNMNKAYALRHFYQHEDNVCVP